MAEDVFRRGGITRATPVSPGRRHDDPALALSHRLLDLLLRAAHRLVRFKLLKILAVERVHPAFLLCPAPYGATFLDERSLREHAADPVNELSTTFLDEAFAKGDECFGIVVGNRLAAYGWYAFGATRIHPRDLVLRVSNRYVYMYKGFTHPSHRGRRLYTIGMNLALAHYLGRGFAGMASYVESNNFRALQSTRRMGFATLGTVALLRIFGLYVTCASPGCRKLGLRIEPTES
jgi:hypothetical protein